MAKTSKYVNFSFPISSYFPDALQSGFSEKELRKEYSRLRDIAQKRLARLRASEFKGTTAVKYNVGRFKKLSDIEDITELSHLLSDAARFLTSQMSTVSGQKEYRRKSVETMQEGGLTAISEKNFLTVTKALDWASAFREFDPSELVRMLNTYAAAGVDLNKVMANIFELYEQWIGDHTIRTDWDE